MVTDERAGDMAGFVPSARGIFRQPLDLGLADRWLLRGAGAARRPADRAIHGLHHIEAAGDPFILAINHSIRREAILVPALLFLHRRGRLIHFLADWNFRLCPGVGLLFGAPARSL